MKRILTTLKWGYMFDYIPTVLRSQEIIDKSFHKASNIVEPYYPKKETKIRKEVTDRISTIESISTGHLDKIIRKFPTIETLHPFYFDLIDLMFDVDKYKLSLGNVQWTTDKIKDFSTIYIKKLKGVKNNGIETGKQKITGIPETSISETKTSIDPFGIKRPSKTIKEKKESTEQKNYFKR